MHTAFMTASEVLLAVLGLALLQSSHAVNISNGQRIYGSICSTCHSSRVTNNVYGILAGANDPDFIRRTIAIRPPMQFLGSILSFTEIDDVASYLGNHDGLDPDRIFNWSEWKYSDVFKPAGVSSQVAAGYYYRYYAQSDNYVGISGGRVFYYVPGMSAPLEVGAAVSFLELAAADNF